MENNAGWHGKAPNDEEYATAMADLEKVGEALCPGAVCPFDNTNLSLSAFFGSFGSMFISSK